MIQIPSNNIKLCFKNKRESKTRINRKIKNKRKSERIKRTWKQTKAKSCFVTPAANEVKSQLIISEKEGHSIATDNEEFKFSTFAINANRIPAADRKEFERYKIINKNNIELYKKLLDSKIEYKKLDVYNVDLLEETFDFILFFGLYYHLTDMISALKKIYSVVNESVFLAGHILDSEDPIMYYYDLSDPNSFCQIVASPQCLINIAKNICGFKSAKLVDTIDMPYEKAYAHFSSGSKNDKIGLFEFSKQKLVRDE